MTMIFLPFWKIFKKKRQKFGFLIQRFKASFYENFFFAKKVEKNFVINTKMKSSSVGNEKAPDESRLRRFARWDGNFYQFLRQD